MIIMKSVDFFFSVVRVGIKKYKKEKKILLLGALEFKLSRLLRYAIVCSKVLHFLQVNYFVLH